MNFESIKKTIQQFKSKKTFEEVEYKKIINDLDNLYNNKKKGLFHFTNYEYILKEKENFKKYLIGSLLQKSNEAAKTQKFQLALTCIKQLKNLNPSEKEIQEVDKIKQYCEIRLSCLVGNGLVKKKRFKQAIKHFKNLKQISNNVIQHDIYNRELELAKTSYINSFSEEMVNLLQKVEVKNKLEKNEDILKKCEKLFEEFKYENFLKQKMTEIKTKIYNKTLENIIEEKIKQNKNFKNEMEKYKSLLESENIKENKIAEFESKIKFSQYKLKKVEKKESNVLNLKEKELNYISLERINYYLELIKNINAAELDKNLEEDIKTQVINYNNELNNNHENIKKWISLNKDKIKNNSFRGNIFALLNSINKKITGYDILPIQLISVLFLTKNKPKLGGIFLQINTGEGKSLIIQFLAAYLALLGNKVDIISSSSILADRDAEDIKIKEFYSYFGLTSGSASKDQFSENIVYGDTQNFEAAILREEFKEKKIRNNRPFDCVIIDEVDSISLDNIITMTQLTDNFPGRSCYFVFYCEILICYCTIINELPEITGKSKEYFYQHQNEFKDIIHEKIKKLFIGKLLEDDGKTLKNETPMVFPRCMKNNIENSIDVWIDNVIRAFTMVENRDFVIKDNIVPVDYSNTGVLQNNMIWDGGLQQILQIIHNTKGTYENENTNFLSNISFFKRYKGNIYGVTGTFGGENFQYILKKVYEITLYKIPPNKESRLEDWGSFVYIEEQNYINKIKENIKEVVLQKKRSVLLISNSIAKGKEFYDILRDDYKENVMKYFTEDDKATIENVLDKGKIIVATNLAGRGTDIKISDELEKNGGLHVLVSFLPLNQRIEEQNYGRAGRKGQMGSHILIMLYKNEYGILKEEELSVQNIKNIRDQIELKSINSLMENEMKNILEIETFFKDFCSFLKNDCNGCNNYEKSNIEEKWGIILKNKNIEEFKNKYEQLKTSDKRIIQNNLIKLRDIINNSDNTKEFYTSIFTLEPEYSWAAKLRYGCMLAKEKRWSLIKYNNQKNAINELEEVKKIIDYFIGDLSSQSSLNKTAFGFLEKNKELIKDKNFKTEIEKQNDTRKNFLEAIKFHIDCNIDTINTFIKEDKSDNTIELEKLLTIEDIIKASKNININVKSDIKIYMNEFGFITFEKLIIKKNKTYIGNLIISALGIIEFCVGAALLMFSSNPYFFKIANYLIREGIKDCIKGVYACIKGEEINLKSYAIEKGISVTCFALELAIGKAQDNIGNTFKDKFLGVVKNECVNMAKTYGKRYVANQIVKKLISKMSGKIKDYLINPLMNMMNLNGQNIDIYIYYDILHDSDKYKEAIINQCDNILDNLDNLIDFIGPIIEIAKILINEKDEKISKFLEYMTNFDFKSLIEVSKNIHDLIKNTKVEVKTNNNLSTLVKSLDESLTKEEIDNICKELIETGVINEKGEFNSKFIGIKDFKQCFPIKIDEEYSKYNYIKREISDDLEKKIDFLALKVSKLALENKKKEIKDEIYERLETFTQSLVERILDLIEDKISEKFQQLWDKYKKKKQVQNEGKEIGENNEEENTHKNKKNNDNSQYEEEENIISTKVKPNQTMGEEEKIILPEINSEEINKTKKKDSVNKNENNEMNNTKKEKKIKKVNEEVKKEEKTKKAKSIIEKGNLDIILKETCKFGLEYGIKEGAKSVIIPKLVNVLSNWFRSVLKDKLLPKLLDKFDEFFEMFGERVIELQVKYNIKNYMDKVLYSIEISFHYITAIKTFIIPTLKETINDIKKDKKQINTHQIICEFNEKLIKLGEEKVFTPIKNFINNIFADKNDINKYQLYEKIIEEGYAKVRKLGIEKYKEYKSNVKQKCEESKTMYLDKKKEICDLPDILVKKYNDKKEEYIKLYNEKKTKFIETTDKIINDLKKNNLITEFNNIMRKIKNYIFQKLNDIQNIAKESIQKISSIIPNCFENLIGLIDAVLNLNFGSFDENKINICEYILNFLIQIESGNIKLTKKNEKEEEVYEDGKELLINYLNQQLNIEKKNIIEIIEYLLKNGLKSILIRQINKVINYGKKQFAEIKKLYEPMLKLIKDKCLILKQNFSNFIDEYKGKLNNNIETVFEFLIKFLISKYKLTNVLDYFLKKNIFSENYQNELLEYIQTFKNDKISELTSKFEEEMKKLNHKIDKKVQELKIQSKTQIKKIVNKTEKKVFGYLNKALKDIKEEEEKKNEEDEKYIKKEKVTEEEEKEKAKEKIDKNSQKDKNKKEKKKKISEFDVFDKSMNEIGNKIDKKICENASKLENKFINCVKKCDIRKKVQKKFSEEIGNKTFNDFFNKIEVLKGKEKNFIESKNIKDKCGKLDKFVNKVIYSKHTERAINFIDEFDVENAKNILDGAKVFSNLLDSKEKKEFTNNAKELIKTKIFNLYDNLLEPELKQLVINLGESLVDMIDRKINKRKEDKNNN